MDGMASGSSTCRSSSRMVMPIATPASRIARSMPRSPAIVVRTIGSSPYRISTTTAARAPTPPASGTGSRKPNIARLGIVCTTLAMAMSGAARRGRRAAKMPIGTPIATATSVDAATSSRCCASSVTSSCRCVDQKRTTDHMFNQLAAARLDRASPRRATVEPACRERRPRPLDDRTRPVCRLR